MALTDENNGIGATMLVSPTGGNFGGYTMPMMPFMPYQQNGGMFGGNDSWLGILFLIALCNGGFGGGFGGFGGNQLGYDFPWILNGQNGINNNVSDGFRDAQLHDSVTSVRDGISNLATQLCNCCGDMQLNMSNGFNSVNNSIFGAQSSISQQMNANEIASLNRSFAEQTANMQGFNGLQSQLAQCCCDNRLATAQTQALVLSENCADRAALSEGIRDILVNNTANTQRILDQMCNDKIDAKNERIADLERQLTMANLAASQTAQTNDIVNQTYSRLSTCPVGTTPVYGNQPIFTCPVNVGNSGCGCNGGNF